MTEEKKAAVKAGTEVKPFWQSPSFWLTILACAGVVFDKLVLDGVIPDTGWAAIVIAVVGLVTKRGMTENATIKAKTLAALAPKDPQ